MALTVPVNVAILVSFSVKCLRGGSLAEQVAVLQVSEAHKAAIDWINGVVSAEGISCDLEKTTGWAPPQSCITSSDNLCLSVGMRAWLGNGLFSAVFCFGFATTTYCP